MSLKEKYASQFTSQSSLLILKDKAQIRRMEENWPLEDLLSLPLIKIQGSNDLHSTVACPVYLRLSKRKSAGLIQLCSTLNWLLSRNLVRLIPYPLLSSNSYRTRRTARVERQNE